MAWLAERCRELGAAAVVEGAVDAAELDALARFRPVLVWLDDPHEADITAALAHGTHELPILVVASGAPGGPVEALVDADAMTITLGPLPDDDLHTLADRMLPLEDEARRRLVARAAGAPGFVRHVLADLVQRQRLRAGSDRWRIWGDVDREIPETMADLRRRRVRVACGRRGSEALSVAARLGPRVSVDEWRSACAQDQVVWLATLPQRLLDSGLARPTPDGLHLDHGLTRHLRGRPAQRHPAPATADAQRFTKMT